jgi:hypothetical protein
MLRDLLAAIDVEPPCNFGQKSFQEHLEDFARLEIGLISKGR